MCLETNTSLIDCWQVNKYINLYTTVGNILHEMSEYRFGYTIIYTRHCKSRSHEIQKIPKYIRIFYESDWHQIIVSDSVTLKLQMDLCISHSNVVSLSYLMPTVSANSFGLYFQKETPRKFFPLCTTFSPPHGCYDILVIS